MLAWILALGVHFSSLGLGLCFEPLSGAHRNPPTPFLTHSYMRSCFCGYLRHAFYTLGAPEPGAVSVRRYVPL